MYMSALRFYPRAKSQKYLQIKGLQLLRLSSETLNRPCFPLGWKEDNNVRCHNEEPSEWDGHTSVSMGSNATAATSGATIRAVSGTKLESAEGRGGVKT